MRADHRQLFGRAGWIESPELGEDHHDIHKVGKLSIGALYTINEIDRELRPSYGGANPNGVMVFLQFFAGS